MVDKKIRSAVQEFMQRKYPISPSPESLEILVSAGFKLLKFPGEQLENIIRVEKNLQGRDLDTLVAKVFSLAYPYRQVLNNDESVRNWSARLGTAEYRLGRAITDSQIKNTLFNKSLEHLLKSREKGNGSKENASYIGSCYFKLGKYEDALPFFLESRKKGDESKENASRIGSCYFNLERYEDALTYYKKSIEAAKKDEFNRNWMLTFNNVFGYSFSLLNRARESLQSPVYDPLLQKFQSLYTEFVEFWKQNEPPANVPSMPIHPMLLNSTNTAMAPS